MNQMKDPIGVQRHEHDKKTQNKTETVRFDPFERTRNRFIFYFLQCQTLQSKKITTHYINNWSNKNVREQVLLFGRLRSVYTDPAKVGTNPGVDGWVGRQAITVRLVNERGDAYDEITRAIWTVTWTTAVTVAGSSCVL